MSSARMMRMLGLAGAAEVDAAINSVDRIVMSSFMATVARFGIVNDIAV